VESVCDERGRPDLTTDADPIPGDDLSWKATRRGPAVSASARL
jgi:hypothetical protein